MDPQHHSNPSSRAATVDPAVEPSAEDSATSPNSATSPSSAKASDRTPAVPAAKTASEGQKTEIGSTIVIRGKLKSDEDLVVRGRIEADITSSKSLHVENSGIIKATVQVSSARIDGILVGNVTASDKLEIAAEGRVVGDLYTPRIVIREGAAFRGNIDMPNFNAVRAKPTGTSAPSSTPKPTSAQEPTLPVQAADSVDVDVDVDIDLDLDTPVLDDDGGADSSNAGMSGMPGAPDANRGGFLGRKSKKRRN